MTPALRLLPLLVAATLATGCASLTRSDYARPEAELASQWQHGSAATGAARSAPARWWTAFQDSRLDALMDEALQGNANLAASAIKLSRARLNAGLAADAQRPTLSASGAASQSRALEGDAAINRSYSTKAALGWEVDLWGRLAHARDASEWEATASAQDLAAVRLSLTGSVAQQYWKLAWLNERIALADANIVYAERTAALAHTKFDAGSVSRLDVLQAEQDIASQRAARALLVQQREEARTSFALLFDGAPQRRFVEPQKLPPVSLPEVAAGLPADVLAQRPDLAAAESRLRGTLATADATRTAYYPRLALTGSIGTSSDTLRRILENPVGALASELTLPFLQYREMQLKSGVARADYDLAVVQFRQTLYSALGDVENALSARRQYQQQGEQLERSLAAAQGAERINEIRYRSGAVALQTWLDSQQTRRSAEVSALENRYNQLVAHSTLVLALGGSTE